MKTHLKVALPAGRAVRVLVVEASTEAGEPASSFRLRSARAVGQEPDEPTVPEFKELHRWTKNAKLARGA